MATGIKTVKEIMSDETGQLFNPTKRVKNGTKIQVKIVQPTIKPSVFLILPNALSALTTGLEKAENMAETANR